MNNRELINAKVALRELGKYELPVRLSLKIRQMTRSINHLAEDVEAERQKIVDACVLKSDDGSPKTKSRNGAEVYDFGPNTATFNAKLKELMDADSAGMPAPIKASEFGDARLPGWIVDGLGELVANNLFDMSTTPLTVTRKAWYEAHDALRGLLGYTMPVVVALRASLALKALEGVYQTRKELIEAHAVKDEDGEPQVLIQEGRMLYEFGKNRDAFSAADDTLGKEKAEVNLVQLQASELPEDMILPPALLSQLGDLMADM